MPLLGFKKRFKEDVKSGKKRQTIRACRKDGRDPKTGEMLYLYVGLRTKFCEKLREDECISSEPIIIDHKGYLNVLVDNESLNPDEIERLIYNDGFDCYEDFVKFFRDTHGFPFRGYLIKW